MQLKKLDQSFYTDNTHLTEVLDNFNGNWQNGKIRGYGVVIINLNGLTFAIPLRSNIKHHAAYITVKSSIQGVKGKGLDYSKAVLISQASYVSNSLFKISPGEHKKLKNKEVFITNRFEKYVEHYIKAVQASDQNILQSAEYRYTTLKNYHSELGV
jgi:protein AbiQ